MPIKLGDVTRCRRCKHTWTMEVCKNCDELHPKEDVPPACGVVDIVWEMCPGCASPIELAALRQFVRTERAALVN